jgi:undecaprenyl-diphosphatase
MLIKLINNEALLIHNIQILINNNKFITGVLLFFTNLFYLKYFIIILLLFYLFNKITINQIIILFISILIVGFIKNIIKRDRPYITFPNLVSKLDTNFFDRYSFPSGHMTSSILVAYFLNKNMNTNYFYIIPIIVGFSRIYFGVHYPTDIIGGIVLALLIIYISNKIIN